MRKEMWAPLISLFGPQADVKQQSKNGNPSVTPNAPSPNSTSNTPTGQRRALVEGRTKTHPPHYKIRNQLAISTPRNPPDVPMRCPRLT